MIRAILINELRKTVLRNRYAARLGWYPFTSPTLITSRTSIRAVYFTELHDAMSPYLGPLNWSVGSPPSPSRPISARDINELRTWCDNFSRALGLPTGPDPAIQGITSFSFDPTASPMASIDPIWVSDITQLTQGSGVAPLWVRSEVIADLPDNIVPYYGAYQTAYGYYQTANMPVFPLLANKFARGFDGHYNDQVSDGIFSNGFIDYFAPSAASFAQAMLPYGADDCIIWNEPNDTGSGIYLDPRVFASLLWHCAQKFRAGGLNASSIMGGLLWDDTNPNRDQATGAVTTYLSTMLTWLRNNQLDIPWAMVNGHPPNCGDPSGDSRYGFSQHNMLDLRSAIDALFPGAAMRPVYAGEWGPTHAGARITPCLANAYTYLRNTFDAMFLFQHPALAFPFCCDADGRQTCPYASPTNNNKGADNDYGCIPWTCRAPPPGGPYQLFTVSDHCPTWLQFSAALASSAG